MEAFARLLDRLYFTSGNKAKAELVKDYLKHSPDPDRGWAIAAMGGTLRFDLFKRRMIRDLITARVDPVLFELSYDYVGETSETVAHLWPASERQNDEPLPGLHEIVTRFQQSNRAETEAYLVSLLDRMTPSQRWALLKLGTRGLRIGISARFLKKILAQYGGVSVEDIETLWHGVEPPYTELLAWLDGKAPKPDVSDRVTFHPVMLSHPLEDRDLAKITPEEWVAEWKYDGIRVQLVSTREGCALFTRTGDDISHSFPDIIEQVDFHGIFDGELLVMRGDTPGTFNELQQRLNKKKPSKKLIAGYPCGLVLYDVLQLDDRDLTAHPLQQRRQWLSDFASKTFTAREASGSPSWLFSESLAFTGLADLHALRDEAAQSRGPIEGLMLKRADSLYVPGRPKGQWYKWKRDPLVVDAIMMYAQRGHGKRSSFYSDFTFGLWQEEAILPVGKAYSGFTDEELKKLDRWVRNHTVGRFGPVREVEKSLVVELAFDAVQSSNRHKSGVALRFPRISRLRWDKPAAEADRLETLVRLIDA